MKRVLLSAVFGLFTVGAAHAASFGGGSISAGVTNQLTGQSGAGLEGNIAVTHQGYAEAYGTGLGASSLQVTPTSINTLSIGSGAFRVQSSPNGGANAQFEALGLNTAQVDSFGGFNAAGGFTAN